MGRRRDRAEPRRAVDRRWWGLVAIRAPDPARARKADQRRADPCAAGGRRCARTAGAGGRRICRAPVRGHRHRRARPMVDRTGRGGARGAAGVARVGHRDRHGCRAVPRADRGAVRHRADRCDAPDGARRPDWIRMDGGAVAMTTADLAIAPAAAPGDEALIAAARGGDHAAYTALYQRYAARVYARLTQLIGPSGDREDLLQQVFLELYRALPRFRAESSIGTFIYGIAVHVALDHLRRRGRRPQHFTAVELDELI